MHNLKFTFIKEKKKHNGIREIAERAKVSIGPVDKVLNNRGGVSAATEKRILQAIKDLGYKPNVLASRLKSSKAFTIAVLIPEASEEIPYWAQYQEGFERSKNELAHFGFNLEIFHFKQTSEVTYKREVDKIIRGNYDGIFVAPIFANETIRLLDLTRKSRTPVIFFDTNIPDLENLSFIGQHSMDSGNVAADLLNSSIPKSGTILIVTIVMKDDNHSHFAEREKGFRSFFKNSNRKIIRYQNAHFHKEQIETELKKLLAKSTDIKGIFVANGTNIVAAVIDDLKDNDYRLIGYDLITENLYYLKKGIIKFLISQKPSLQAYKGMMLFHEYLILKQPIEKSYFMPIDIVMNSNLKYYT